MCKDSQSPDPLIGQAAKANVDLAKEALTWYMAKYEENKPRQAALDAKSMEFADQQMETSRFQTQVGKEQWDRYRTVGMDAEDAMYRDSANYDSAEKQAEAAGMAATDVQTALAKSKQITARDRARLGINPADGRAQAMEQDQATVGALAEASAMTGARRGVRDMGIMLRKDAAAAAKGMPSTAAQTYGVAGAAGAGATGAIQGSIASANSSVSTAGQGFNTAISGNNSAGSMLNQEYATKTQASKGSDFLSGVGSIGMGLGAMGFSDENMKESVKPVSGKVALAGVNGVNVKKWKYRDDSPAADGGREHIGAMAQDMQDKMGDTVAPGGKMVDLISAIGVNMAATKELSKQVTQLKKTMGKEKSHG